MPQKNAFSSIRPTKVNFYLRCMEKFGFSERKVLAETGLNSKKLQDRHFLVTVPDYIRVVSNMMQLTQQPGDLGILGHTVSACSNTIEGMAVWQKYNHLFFGNLFSLREATDGRLVTFEFIENVQLLPHILQFFVEEKLSYEVTLFKRFNERMPQNRHYSFNYKKPAHAHRYEALLETKGKFSAAKTIFAFSKDDVYYTKPFPGADQETLDLCLNYLDQVTSVIYTQTTFSAKLRALIRENLPKVLTVEDMAKHFSCSSRTFCRNLELEQSNYKTEIAHVREELTKGYLSTSSLSIGEIAVMLGFANAASLRRAFKQWTGHTISDYRESLH